MPSTPAGPQHHEADHHLAVDGSVAAPAKRAKNSRKTRSAISRVDGKRVRVVDNESGGSIDSVASVSSIRERILGAPDRGLLGYAGKGQHCDWSRNTGGRRLRSVGVLAKPAVEWLDWDAQTARIAAGATITEVSEALLTDGWCLPVLAGDPRMTVAAAVSAGLSGPDQARFPSLGQSIRAIEVVDGLGELHRATAADSDADLFWASIGGLGLLGIITAVEIAIRPVSSGWLLVDSQQFDSLADACSAAENPRPDTYTNIRLDVSEQGISTGRCTLVTARHARVSDLPASRHLEALTYEPADAPSVPANVPRRLWNPLSAGLLHSITHRSAPALVNAAPRPLAEHFHTRASIPTAGARTSGWLNYDFYLPSAQLGLLSGFLADAHSVGCVPYAANLVRTQAHRAGPLSWGEEGWSVQLFLPTADHHIATTLDSFDERLADAGGRVRLATDSRVRPDVLAAMFPDLETWHALRSTLDPHHRIQSDIARRLHL